MVLRHLGHGTAALAAAVAVAGALAAPTAALAEGTSLWRLYNPYDGQHLLTTSESEYDSLQPLGWRGEGEAWESPDEGDPVYRLYNPYSGDHLYTGDASEYAALARIGWLQEGVAFRSADASAGTPIFSASSSSVSALTSVPFSRRSSISPGMVSSMVS